MKRSQMQKTVTNGSEDVHWSRRTAEELASSPRMGGRNPRSSSPKTRAAKPKTKPSYHTRRGSFIMEGRPVFAQGQEAYREAISPKSGPRSNHNEHRVETSFSPDVKSALFEGLVF